MTQGEIMKLLEKEEKPLSNREITRILGVANAGSCIRKLVKNKDIKTVAIMIPIRTGTGTSNRPIIHYFV